MVQNCWEQAAEVQKLFGQQTYNQCGQAIVRNFFGPDGNFAQPPDPLTGQPMTMAEYVARLTGKDLEAARAAANGNRQARQVARQAGTPAGTAVGGPADSGGPLSRAEAIAEIEANEPGLRSR